MTRGRFRPLGLGVVSLPSPGQPEDNCRPVNSFNKMFCHVIRLLICWFRIGRGLGWGTPLFLTHMCFWLVEVILINPGPFKGKVGLGQPSVVARTNRPQSSPLSVSLS